MKTLVTIVFCLIFLQLATGPADAVMYRWVDQNGVVHFSDTPPASDQNLETRETTTYVKPDPPPARTAPRRGDVEKPAIKSVAKAQHNEVEIYTTNWCGYCKKAIAFLKANNISYQQHDIDKDAAAKKRMKAMNPRGGVPFAIINGKQIRGYSDGTYRRVLGLSE